jgi:hypothetical protein
MASAGQPEMVRRDWLSREKREIPESDRASWFRQRAATRAARLRDLPAVVFLENTEFGNAPRLNMSLSDGPYRGKPFRAGAAIKILKADAQGQVSARDLLKDPEGMIRDLDVSFDGKRILFSWKKSLTKDFHIHEMTVETGKVRQVTREPGVADIQARYMPGDRILYHSTRCVNVVDCNESIDVVNLFTCDMDGKDIRRLAFDQVSTQFPALLADGRIVYTRWDYNDRGQIYPQGLFTMNTDGTQQKALYGNNSFYPTSLIQARSLPGTQKLLAIASGHHTPPCGKLVTVDISKGTEEGLGVEWIAPERRLRPLKKDKADQDEALFQYPYPLNRDEYLTGFSLLGKKKSGHFAIYWMNRSGQRELLAWHDKASYRHPMPLLARPLPPKRTGTIDLTKDYGTFYVDNVYIGRGLKGVKKGTIKKLRVIGLEFRAAAVGTNYNRGEAGNARVCTPVSISGSWDVKRVLGDARVHEDGSAFFRAPARMAVYFQALDDKGHAVQSMRSWATLQPGEPFSCTGCHDDKRYAPAPPDRVSMALKAGAQELEPFYGPARGFSFLKEIQPILDRHCVKCHKGRVYPNHEKGREDRSFSLLPKPVTDKASKRLWTESYVSLLQATVSKGSLYAKSNSFINWISPQSGPTVRVPYSFGAASSEMVAMLTRGHPDKAGKPKAKLSRQEMDRIACWIDLAVPFCGDYLEANNWSDREKGWYRRQEEKQKRLEASVVD